MNDFREKYPHVRVIGFAGFARAGKSTAARLLREDMRIAGAKASGPPLAYAEALSFAKPLREICKATFPYVDAKYFDEQEFKEVQIPGLPEGITGRKILVHMGTEGVRHLVPDAWVRLAESMILSAAENGVTLITFDDVRFFDEAALIRRYGQLYRIERPGCEPGGHASELYARDLPVDGVIENDATIAKLATRLAAALKE